MKPSGGSVARGHRHRHRRGDGRCGGGCGLRITIVPTRPRRRRVLPPSADPDPMPRPARPQAQDRRQRRGVAASSGHRRPGRRARGDHGPRATAAVDASATELVLFFGAVPSDRTTTGSAALSPRRSGSAAYRPHNAHRTDDDTSEPVSSNWSGGLDPFPRRCTTRLIPACSILTRTSSTPCTPPGIGLDVRRRSTSHAPIEEGRAMIIYRVAARWTARCSAPVRYSHPGGRGFGAECSRSATREGRVRLPYGPGCR